MKVFTICNEAQRELHAAWEDSMTRAGMVPVTRWFDGYSDGNFCGEGYGSIIRARSRMILDALDGETDQVAFSDVDVLAFHADLPAYLTEELGKNDAAFAREVWGENNICCGFWTARPNRETRRFALRVCSALVREEQNNDQPIVNAILAKNPKMKWGILGDEVQSGSMRPKKRTDCFVYHANCTIPNNDKTSMELKRESLAAARARYSTTVVAAHTEEDLKWLEEIEAKVCVVTSDANCKASKKMLVPNKGREAGKWLRWIIATYPNFSEYTAFVQGGGRHHCKDIVTQLNSGFFAPHGFFPLGDLNFGLFDRKHTGPKESEKDDPDSCNFAFKLLGGASPFARWTCGAQMVVHRARLLRHPVTYFQELLELVETHPRGPWMIERRWFELL